MYGRKLLIASLFFCQSLFAVDLPLLWGASPDVSVTGYALYYSQTNSAVTNRIDVGNKLTTVVSNLNDLAVYEFFVVAYNSVGTESLPSNTLIYGPHGYSNPNPPNFFWYNTNSLNFIWDASPDASVIGYYFYWGIVTNYTIIGTNNNITNYTELSTNKVDVGNVLTNSVAGFKVGPSYYAYVTAYNAAGTESDPSNSLFWLFKVSSPTNIVIKEK